MIYNFECCQTSTEELDGIIASLLNSMALFQLRLKEKDPIKAKSKLRFVVGMKQVTNAIKAGKSRDCNFKVNCHALQQEK